MKNYLIKFLVFNAFLIVGSLHSQEYNYEINYMSFKKSGVDLDTMRYDKKTINLVKEIFDKQFQKSYILKINSSESIYEEAKTLSINSKPQEINITYKNLVADIYLNKLEFLGKLFLVTDSIPKFKWEITEDSKSIAGFKVYKAKAIIPEYTFLVDKFSEEITEIYAWYTNEIPLSHGPSIYSGLPGLILEIYDGTHTILCTKINLLTVENKIKIPKGGKEINRQEFSNIMLKKLKEGKQKAIDFMLGLEFDKNN